MKSKSTLIPKRKMWISFTFIFLPVLILVFLKLFNFNEYLDSDKLLKLMGSISLIGMFLLLMTQWTKDDGDEMHLKFRLIASLQGIIYAIGFLFTMAVFEMFGIENIDYSGHVVLLMIMLWSLYSLGSHIYKAKKELKEDS